MDSPLWVYMDVSVFRVLSVWAEGLSKVSLSEFCTVFTCWDQHRFKLVY